MNDLEFCMPYITRLEKTAKKHGNCLFFSYSGHTRGISITIVKSEKEYNTEVFAPQTFYINVETEHDKKESAQYFESIITDLNSVYDDFPTRSAMQNLVYSAYIEYNIKKTDNITIKEAIDKTLGTMDLTKSTYNIVKDSLMYFAMHKQIMYIPENWTPNGD